MTVTKLLIACKKILVCSFTLLSVLALVKSGILQDRVHEGHKGVTHIWL